MDSLLEYADKLFSEPAAHLFFELVVVLLFVWMLRRNKCAQDPDRKLSTREKAQLLADFRPEPLCSPVSSDHYALNSRRVSGRVGVRVSINGKNLLNMATHNYLGLADRPQSTGKAIGALRNYGVGSCGPRGFYGTADVHLELEKRLAQFIGVEEACLYSYGFSAISSGIPSYSKKGDVIFADEEVSFPIQQGITASRSTAYYFKHNDPADLERLLEAQDERDRKDPKKGKSIRRFLILEGIYMNTGTMVNLPEMIKLRAKYRCRLFMDESISFGTIGKTGKGVREHFNIPNREIDLMAATLEHGVSSFGGFLCGSHFLMEHQRLCGLAYCFSASLPPLQAVLSISHLDIISEQPENIEKLQNNCKRMHDIVSSLEKLKVDSFPSSPLKFIHLRDIHDRCLAQKKIDEIVTYAENKGIALCSARYLDEEILEHEPAIKLTVSCLLTNEDLSYVGGVLRNACEDIL